MRILANYGYKMNGDTYSVTFETLGDVPRERADETVDELFGHAKAAVQRQLDGAGTRPLDSPPKDEVVIPQPRKNGNGKPQLKDPDAPLTWKQKSLIIRLAKERGQFIDNLDSFTMQQACDTIDELMAVGV